jgi:DNA (cytosine-5)-methyltransferase 1
VKYGSICSGIEAASVAWHGLGWTPAWFAEIEPFPSAVLAHHYPNIPNLGDMTKIAARVLSMEIEAPEVLVGGTPCQAFSVAGLRESLNDDRGQLSLAFIHLADSIDAVRRVRGKPASIVVWENVPGVLSTKDNAFGCFLAGLAGEDCELQPPGKKWADAGCVLGPKRTVAWRILDAQYFGLAQRRRRVFVVASAREGFDPCAVLFERDGMRRDTPPSRQPGEEVTPTIRAGASNGGAGHGARSGDSKDELIVPVPEVVGALTSACGPNGHGGSGLATDKGAEAGHILACGGESLVDQCVTGDITHTLKAEGFDASEDGTGRGQPIVVHGTQDPCVSADTAFALGRYNGGENVLAFAQNQRDEVRLMDVSGALAAEPGMKQQTYVTSPIAYTTKLHNTGSNNAGKIFEERTTCLDANSPPPALLTAMQVRRLMPEECEPLQGFPKGYTRIPVRAYKKRRITKLWPADMWEKMPDGSWMLMAADGPRYKALGNSMAVPVMLWIGNRIQREAA